MINSPDVPPVSGFETATYRKVVWRLMPYLFLCYILAYVDRVNVGFAKLQMQQDLHMSDSVYGLGAGIFFIGYFFFEVPSNVIMQKVGARFWIGPIMIAWGVVSSCTMLVRSATGFYALRFLLGVVESGFFPGVILYLTFWFTSRHRAKMVAVFMSAIPLSGVVAGPISGWILGRMSGAGHLAAWQWLFLVEGIPSFLAGLITLYFLTDNPAKAVWLDDAQKRLILGRLQEEEEAKKRSGRGGHKFADAFRNPAVWLLCVVYFGMTAGNYGIGFWLPQVIKDGITSDPLVIGWITVIPWAAAAAAMLVVGHHSDATGERRWHFSLSAILVAVSFAASAFPGIPGPLRLAALTVATVGIMSSFAVFWALPTAILSGTAAAAGIAWINSVGNLGGWASPYVVGAIRDRTHSMTLALLALSAVALVAALAALVVTRPQPVGGESR
ncbi:MAG TPA: MFS transporter [Bryobacteraceae bacterium]|nr:MFS transporter [Bryobacteraceae bacterium]